MPYKIFLSHSSKDSKVVDVISKHLSYEGMEVIIAQNVRSDNPPEYVAEKIKKLIIDCDCLVALITKNAEGSSWLHQERGYALDVISIIPLVQNKVDFKKLAMLDTVDSIIYDPKNLDTSIAELLSWTTKLKGKKESTQALKSIALVVLGAIIIAAALTE
jgi:hypothetical protein